MRRFCEDAEDFTHMWPLSVPSKTPRRLALLAAGLAGVGALVALASHGGWAKRVLLDRGVKCPVASNAQVAAVQQATLAAIQKGAGARAAPVRPALGFALDRTTIADLRTWASHLSVVCAEEKEATLVRCSAVPTFALPESHGGEGIVDEIVFGLRATDGTLFSVDAFRKDIDGPSAERQTAAIASTLKGLLGAPELDVGTPVSTGAGEAYVLRFAFSDCIVELTTARLASGIALRERYMSARPPS